MAIRNTSGQLALLRVHDKGTKYGPSSDTIDVEVVAQFAGRPTEAFGFQLRDDAKGPAREGMLGLMRDGFNYGWIVNVDYDIKPGKKNAVVIRTWLTKPRRPGGGVVGPIGRSVVRRGG
jgi:hypothetical protein